MKRTVWLAIAAGAALTCSGFALMVRRQQSSSQVVHNARTTSFVAAQDVSTMPLNDVLDLMDRHAQGLPPPSGFVVDDFEGRVKAELTDLSLPSGEQQLLVTVIDDSVDLDTAALSVDGDVVCRATRDAGSIVDRSGHGIATLVGYVFTTGPVTVKVEWVTQSGFTFSDEVAIR